MAGSTSNLDLIATAQAQKEVTANALFDAQSPATLFGRRASTCAALTWGYYGGAVYVQGTSEALVQIPNATVVLAASDTNYVEADADGVVTTNVVGWTTGSTPLYEIVTGASTVTSYIDWRVGILGAGEAVESVNGLTGVVSLDAGDIGITDAGTYYTGTDVEAALQEIGADLAALVGGGDVTAGSSDITQYAVVVGDGGTSILPLASLGTAGQVLTSAGAGAPPSFQSLSSPVGRHAVYIAAGSMSPSVAGGCAALAGVASAANQPDIRTLNFDATTQEYAQFALAMPKSWDEGTLTFVAHWSHAATTTNFGVVWDLQAVAVSDDDAIEVAYGTAQNSTDTGGTTNDVYRSPESSAITVAGTPAAEDTVFFRLSRVTGNGSDTMAIDARLHGITVFLTTNAGNDS